MTLPLALWLALAALSQRGPAAPTCRRALDSLDAKVRQNYAGFQLEVTGDRRVEYDDMLRRAERDADGRTYERCYQALARYIEWFGDPHLFVFQSQQVDTSVARRRAAALTRLDLTEDRARAELTARGRSLDPIEGIWYDGTLRVAVVPEPGGEAGRFVAVVVASDTAAWPAGAVRARFTRRADSAYTTTLLTRGFAELELTARIHKNVLMRFSPGIWGKAFPVAPADTGLLDPIDPRKPHASIRKGAVLFSIPSHDPVYTRVVDSLVKAYLPAIRVKGWLIVDLRGNEGGGSQTTRALNPIIASPVRRPTPYDSGQAVMLASPAQIAYAKRFTGTDTSAFVRNLVARMEANPGKLVVMEPNEKPPAPEPVTDGDWHVLVLTDRGTVSAAEVLVLRALRSERARVIGEPTAGALDYQSVSIVGLGIGDRRWALGYPTITAHADLPRRGMRGKGIAPQILTSWSGNTDALQAAEASLGAGAVPSPHLRDPFRVINLMPRYWAFRDTTEGFPIAEQVRVFRQMVIGAEPRFYEQVIGATSDERLAEYLTTMAPLDSAMRQVSRRMVNAIPAAWGRVAGFFRVRGADGMRIYVVPSIFQSNGQVRYVDDSLVVMLGPDVQTYVDVVIDSGRAGMSPEVAIMHELSHYHHWRKNPEIAEAAKSFFRPGAYSSLYYNLWSEGFATWVARTLNPDQPLSAILGPGLDPARGPELLSRLAGEFLSRFESTREDDVRDLFYLSGRRQDIPLRSAYYVGYQVAAWLARSRSPEQLARLRGDELKGGVREALQAMAANQWEAAR